MDIARGEGGARGTTEDVLAERDAGGDVVVGVAVSGAAGGISDAGVGIYAPGIIGPMLGWRRGGSGAVSLRAGLGSLAGRAAAEGLALRLLMRDEGLPRPEREVAASSGLGTAGATTAIDSSGDARTAAALSRTEGTAYSICSVPLLRAIRCGFGGCDVDGGDGAMDSMSRSNIADEDEWLHDHGGWSAFCFGMGIK